MTNNLPLVSVCIPSYNNAHYIAGAIDSVLSQTYGNFELVIVDDESTDATAQIVHGYEARCDLIRFYRNETNLGMAENWNRCLEIAGGDFIKVMGADDLLEPTCIEKSVNALVVNPAVSLVACARTLIDERGRSSRTSSYSSTFTIKQGLDVVRRCFFTANWIGEPVATMFKKKDALRGFDPHYHQLTDLEMWFHLLEKGDFAFIPEPLCSFRVHAKQTTKTNVRTLAFMSDEILLYHDYINKDYLGETVLHTLHWKFKLCFTIWMQRANGLDIELIKSEIKKYMPLFIFYPLAYFKALKDKVLKLFMW
jgi:glycosyltransferase involved in cell wall biosynthesis